MFSSSGSNDTREIQKRIVKKERRAPGDMNRIGCNTVEGHVMRLEQVYDKALMQL